MRITSWLFGALLLVLSVAARAETLSYTTYYHNDHLGSPVAATNEQGAVLWRAHFRPYGERQENPMETNFGSVGYTGHAQDAESGMVYMQARYYDPLIGRFMAVDPVGVQTSNPMSFNRYLYANNNPQRYVDPDGQIIETAWDVANIAMGVGSTAANVAAGNYGKAAVDAVGVAVDTLAMLVPGVPGGAGAGIKALRAGDKALDVTKGGKRGPKTDPSAPHNAKIREVADRIEAEGGTIIAGGGRSPEKLIPTPGGDKGGRRPDVLYKDCNGILCGVNVGRAKADGSPVPRETKALNDLNGAGVPTTFVRYN
jgi:RHS repeat-associated protein